MLSFKDDLNSSTEFTGDQILSQRSAADPMVRRRRSAAWAVLAACIALQLDPAWIEPRLYWYGGHKREKRRKRHIYR